MNNLMLDDYNTRQRRSTRVVLCLLAVMTLLLLTSCGIMSPGQQQTAGGVLTELLTDGKITREQYDALMSVLLDSGYGPWLQQLGSALGGAALAWAGIRSNLPMVGRGRPTQKVGLPASKVHPSP